MITTPQNEVTQLEFPGQTQIAEPQIMAPAPQAQVGTWKPHPGPQEFALRLPSNTYEILYGGARGGGKTDAGLVWMTDEIDNPRFRGLIIRRSATDLTDWLDRAGWMYKLLGAKIVGNPAIIRFPSGAIIRTGHLGDDQAYTKYQGHEYQRMLIEELTQIPSEERYIKLLSSCRSTIPGMRSQIFLTTNPGGVGHGWVKKRFVKPFPGGMKRFPDPISGLLRIFVPASVDDNPALMDNDPGYVMQLEAIRATSESLYKAWRHGSWDVPVGQFFTEWMASKSVELGDGRYKTIPWHVNNRFEYGLDAAKKIGTFDWGFTSPGCFTWLAQMPENRYGVRRVVAYRELYLTQNNPEQWAKRIATFVKLEGMHHMVLPHDCFASREGDESIATIFAKWIKAPIKRGKTLVANGRINRAAITHQYLSTAADGLPYLQVHPNCANTIETLPELIHDDTNPEDVNTDGPDHAYDALSMGLIDFGWSNKNSEALKRPQPNSIVPTWHPDQAGNVQSPDFVEGFRRGFTDQRRGSNPEFGN